MRQLRELVRSRPAFERLRFGLLVAVGVLLAHDAVFAAQFGLGSARAEALAATAHEYWPVFTVLTLLAAVVGTGWAAGAFMRLRRLAAGLPAAAPVPAESGYAREVARLWARLFPVVVLVFAVQENVEHLLAGAPAPGLYALSAPGYPLAIPVLAGVTGLLAAVGGWLRYRRRALLHRLCAARSAWQRAVARATALTRRWGLVAALVVHGRILTRLDAGRAPPAPSRA
jgi:hypothetical protein